MALKSKKKFLVPPEKVEMTPLYQRRTKCALIERVIILNLRLPYLFSVGNYKNSR